MFQHAFSKDLSVVGNADEELAKLSKECWDSIARRISKRRRRRNRPSSNQTKDLNIFDIKEEDDNDFDEDTWGNSSGDVMNDLNSSDGSSNDRTDREEEMLFDDFQLADLFVNVDTDDMFNIEKCGDFDWSIPVTSDNLNFVF